MTDPVTARRAQTVQMLDEHLTMLKRHARELKEAIQQTARARALALGIDIDTTRPGGEVNASNGSTGEAEDR